LKIILKYKIQTKCPGRLFQYSKLRKENFVARGSLQWQPGRAEKLVGAQVERERQVYIKNFCVQEIKYDLVSYCFQGQQ